MKCNNPNHKCGGEIRGPLSECNQCGWRTTKPQVEKLPPAKKQVETKSEPNAEN